MFRLGLDQTVQVCGGSQLFAVKFNAQTGEYCLFLYGTTDPLDCFDSMGMAFYFRAYLTYKCEHIVKYQQEHTCSFEKAVKDVLSDAKKDIRK